MFSNRGGEWRRTALGAGTGHLQDVGQHKGKYYSVNVPLKAGVVGHPACHSLIQRAAPLVQKSVGAPISSINLNSR